MQFSLSDKILRVKNCATWENFQAVMFKLYILSANEAY